MFQLFSTPQWFNGWDLVFDAVALLVAVLIAGFSWKVFRHHGENKFAYFSLAFLLVALSLLAKEITSAIIYFTPVREVAGAVLRPLAGPQFSLSDLFYRGGFFVQMVTALGAWLLIFFISQKSRARLSKFYEVSQIALFIYLILLVSFVANFKYFVFYLTSTVILSLVILNYYKHYLNTGNKNSFRVLMAFIFLFLSNLFSIFVFVSEGFYVLGEAFMLLGFLILLYTYGRIASR